MQKNPKKTPKKQRTSVMVLWLRIHVTAQGMQVLSLVWGLRSRVCVCVCMCVCACACARVLSCIQLFVTLWTVACQALLSTEFSRQEYWSGLPFPSPEDLPNPGIQPRLPVSPTLAANSSRLCNLRYQDHTCFPAAKTTRCNC